jgi:hypothetical protein
MYVSLTLGFIVTLALKSAHPLSILQIPKSAFNHDWNVAFVILPWFQNSGYTAQARH